jgi:hypothetical protein
MRSLSCGEREILNQDRDDDADCYPKPIRVSEHTARKDHCCDSCCHGGILAGERYTQLVYLDHEDGHGFKVERHCKIPGCKRSDEHLGWLLKEQDRADAEYHRSRGGEAF